jgi:LysM repeat protein
MAATFSSFAGCIHFITQFLANSYLRPQNGSYYQLLNGQWGKVGQWWGGAPTLEGVYKVGDLKADSGKYATAPHAALAVCMLMNQFMEFTARPVATYASVNPEPNKPVQGANYVVVAGDSLWAIAQRLLGSGARYHEIVALNQLANPNLIRVGQRLKIPSSGIPQPNPQPVSTVKTHTVTPGESLWAISQKYYGTGVEWKKIYEANKNVINNPNVIGVGWVLKIPA